ncbi:MAG: NAD(P)-binding protein [Bacillota bacterium]|jgi:hypothetical protein
MWLKITQFRAGPDDPETRLPDLVTSLLQLPATGIKNWRILRKSLDARHKSPVFIYTLIFEVELTSSELDSVREQHPEVSVYQLKPFPAVIKKSAGPALRPVIVGAGPAGLFAGLRLAAAGFRPLLLERGDYLTERIAKVAAFWREGSLDPDSNIQYGIGGAGTFSDGKLTTRVKHPLIPGILQTLVDLGAPPEILYWQYPHIGTDLLRVAVEKLAQQIIDCGGEIRYRHCLTDLTLKQSRLQTITINNRVRMEVDLLLLAVGNSARDVYRMLLNRGIHLTAKPFAVGVRIEHPQEIIDRAQYGRWAGHPRLGAAEYHLTYQHPGSGRGVYSFCMCPGGMVIGAASAAGGVVTNGMSYQARDSGVANAALVATVNQADFGAATPLAGMEWQERLEERAFTAGGGGFRAPAQRVADFLAQQPTAVFGGLIPSYRPGVTAANLWEILPAGICTAISDSIKYFGRRIKNFAWPEAVLTGVETRTSAPVKILRNEDRETEQIGGIYPIGEGAGYAGGIVSSALDGLKTAELLVERYGS